MNQSHNERQIMKTVKDAARDQVGSKYEYVSYGFMIRRIGGDGKWYGRDNYKTEADARKAFDDSMRASRYQNVGGLTVDFGPDNGDRYERKLVKVSKSCEVLAVGVGPA